LGEYYQPWSFDSSTLALCAWENPNLALIYNVDERRMISVARVCDQSAYDLIWSPITDRLLIVIRDGAILVDHCGKKQGKAICATYISPQLYWLLSGEYFVQISRPAKNVHMKLRFYRGADGILVDECKLDPAVLLPYDEKLNAGLWRDYDPLEPEGSGTVRAVGRMLDEWGEFHFDPASGILYLAVLRLTSIPFENDRQLEDNALHCQVKEKWVAVQLYE
jgi:hypothetical protein